MSDRAWEVSGFERGIALHELSSTEETGREQVKNLFLGLESYLL